MARDYIPKTWDGLSSRVAKDVCNKIGITIAKDMIHAYRSAIKSFYDDYYPHVYRRTRRSYYFAGDDYIGIGGTKSPKRFIKMDADGKGFTVKMVISPGNLTTPYTSLVNGAGTARLTGTVFTYTWVLGQHGGKLPYNAIPEHLRVTNLTPGMWKPLKSTGWTWIPPRMDISPMEQMDSWFNKYATSSNFNRLTRDIVTASINRYITRAQNRYGGLK